jgi:hypothetical protein
MNEGDCGITVLEMSDASVENERTISQAVTSLVAVHLMGAATVCAATSISQIKRRLYEGTA